MIHLPGSDGLLFPPSPWLVYPIPSILLLQQNQSRRYGVEEEAEVMEKRRVKKWCLRPGEVASEPVIQKKLPSP